MVTQIKVTGMVLTAMPVGDYDKRIVLLTRERGKITVFAKGARRQNSPLLACAQPFSFGEFMLYEGRTSYGMVSAYITNYFMELREDFDAVSYGLYFLELAEYITTENTDETDILKLLYQSLRALIKKSIDYELVRCIFELKMLFFYGEAPQVFECTVCHDSKEYPYFSPQGRGLLCPGCKGKSKDAIQISGSAIYAMQYIITSSIEKLYTFTVTGQVLKELRLCTGQYMKICIGKEFRSLEMIFSY